MSKQVIWSGIACLPRYPFPFPTGSWHSLYNSDRDLPACWWSISSWSRKKEHSWIKVRLNDLFIKFIVPRPKEFRFLLISSSLSKKEKVSCKQVLSDTLWQIRFWVVDIDNVWTKLFWSLSNSWNEMVNWIDHSCLITFKKEKKDYLP